jgi:membrane-associated protein
VSSITTDLAGLSGTLALLLIAALVFGETAVFLGFVIPGETAAVLGGVLASRGRVSLPLLIIVVVAAAVTGPLIGYEIGRHLGGRVIAARRMRRVASGMDRAQAVVHRRGGLAVLLGRFVAILRALVPAVAGTTRMPYRTFLIYNMLGGLIWGVGYCLLGYVAGSAYAAIERTVGTGVAIVVAVAVLGGLGFWLVRRHRREQASPGAGGPGAATLDAASLDGASLDGASLDGASLGAAGPDVAGRDAAGPAAAGLDAAGPDEAGLGAAGLDAAEPGVAEPGVAGPDTAEPGVAGADAADPDGTGPGAAGPGAARPTGPERPR